MLKRRLSIFWRVCWSILTPGIILVIFIYTFANLELLKYNNIFYPYSIYGKLLKLNETLIENFTIFPIYKNSIDYYFINFIFLYYNIIGIFFSLITQKKFYSKE